MYPRGETEGKKIDGVWQDVPIPAEYQYAEDVRGAKRKASAKEDEMLRGALGSKRSRRKGEKPGAYSMTDHPGLQAAIWGAESQAGSMPGAMIQSYYRMSPEQQRAFDEQRKQWAARQREVLGLSPLGGRGRRW
jgi:hypothetical protein